MLLSFARTTRERLLLAALGVSVVVALAWWYGTSDSVGRAAAALKSGSSEQRQNAIERLVVFGSPEAVAALRQYVADPDASVASAALMALGRIRSFDGTLEVIAGGLSDPRDEVKLGALQGMIQYPGPMPERLVKPLLDLMLHSSSQPVADAAATCLAVHGRPAQNLAWRVALREELIPVLDTVAEADQGRVIEMIHGLLGVNIRYRAGDPPEARRKAFEDMKAYLRTGPGSG